MNTIKNFIVALLALFAFGLTASPLAFADGKTDAEANCPGCHGVIINGIQAVGSGGRSCAQRTTAEWTATIERMNGKGCGVPAGAITGIANYLATFGALVCYRALDGTSYTPPIGATSCSYPDGPTPPPSYSCPGTNRVYIGNSWVCEGTTTTSSTTTTTIMPPFCNNGPAALIGGSWVCPYPPQLCYDSSGVGQYISGMYPPYPCPTGMSTTPPPTCSGGLPTFDGTAWTCPTTTTSSTTTSTTTSTTLGGTTLTCYSLFPGTVFTTTASSCPSGYSSTLPNCQPLNLVISGSYWYCDRGTTTTSNTSTTTTSSTTTTTLCNTYVNGTTQHPYSGSGSGSCHSFANDDVTGVHIVRDQSYCKKHMSHFNSKGNHVHAYPHPMCM